MTAKDEKEVIKFTKRWYEEEIRSLENSRKKMTEFIQDFIKQQEQLIIGMQSRFTKAIEKQTEESKSFLSAEVSRQLKESQKEQTECVCACRSSTTTPRLEDFDNLSISSLSSQETPQYSQAQSLRSYTQSPELVQSQIEEEYIRNLSNEGLMAGGLSVKFDPTGLKSSEVLMNAIRFLHEAEYYLSELSPYADDSVQRRAIMRCLGGNAKDKALLTWAHSAPDLLSWFEYQYGEEQDRWFSVYDHLPRLSQIMSLDEYVTEFERLVSVNQMAKNQEPESVIRHLFIKGFGDVDLKAGLLDIEGDRGYIENGTCLKRMFALARTWAENGAVANPNLGEWRSNRQDRYMDRW